ncbi:hypothetical protein Dimus_003629 [Dionaea muscipula]
MPYADQEPLLIAGLFTRIYLVNSQSLFNGLSSLFGVMRLYFIFDLDIVMGSVVCCERKVVSIFYVYYTYPWSNKNETKPLILFSLHGIRAHSNPSCSPLQTLATSLHPPTTKL